MPGPTVLQSAIVEAVHDDGTVTVTHEGASASARLAAAGYVRPAAGDAVLVAGDDRERFVVGVLSATRAQIVTRGGVAAEVETRGEAETLRVTDATGRVIFEHRASEGVTVISVPHGDLELRAPNGSIRLQAGKRVEVRAPEADVKVGEARVTSTIDRVRQVVGVLETRAERVIERARNVYRDAEELSQTRAGRIKIIAEKTVHVLGQHTLFKAREDVKIKGEKVYLA
jgi:hypothetical protein